MKTKLSALIILATLLVTVFSSGVIAGPPATQGQGHWWDVVPEDENPSPEYDSILYSEIAPKLREIEVNSNRVKVEVIGQSAGGRNMFLVTLSSPDAMGRLGKYQAIRQTMLKDPDKAQEMIDKFGDFKVPVYINGSIHGDEYTGTDAAIRLIETLAYEDSEEVDAILENAILLINVIPNPDGRVVGTRRNASGFDIDRDFITQSQAETKASVSVLTAWNPMIVLDLHGFVSPMVIEPCTPPHNPNYEYDLYIKWALDQALAMEAELIAQTDETEARIPYRDWDDGWDDWSPIYVAMYAMYHGAYAHTLETPRRDDRGVDAHYAAVWGALKFVAENREAMVRDQIEIFRRGFWDLLQQPIPPELLPEWDQYQDLLIQEFPAAYVIPKDTGFQVSPHQPATLIDFLLCNDIQVEQASQAFTLDGIEYPKGTYVVWMDQPKRGLANVILDDGLDVSDMVDLFAGILPSVWSHPRLWGIDLAVMEEKMDLRTHAVNKADVPQGSVEGDEACAYAYLPTSIVAVKATNDMLERGIILYRAAESFTDSGRTFGTGTIIFPDDPALADELSSRYALDVSALTELPDNTVQMREQRIAVYGDEGVHHCLDELGFGYDEVLRSELNAGVISGYDVFLNRGLRWSDLDADGQASFTEWFAAGGDYVGLSYRARSVQFAIDADIIDVEYEYDIGNAIVRIDCVPDDSVAAGFPENDYAFVYYPVWFTDWATDVEIAVRLDEGDFLLSGFWPDWQTSGAAGMPVILSRTSDSCDVTLIGVDCTFRGHPRNTFRIVANAIYNGLD